MARRGESHPSGQGPKNPGGNGMEVARALYRGWAWTGRIAFFSIQTALCCFFVFEGSRFLALTSGPPEAVHTEAAQGLCVSGLLPYHRAGHRGPEEASGGVRWEGPTLASGAQRPPTRSSGRSSAGQGGYLAIPAPLPPPRGDMTWKSIPAIRISSHF